MNAGPFRKPMVDLCKGLVTSFLPRVDPRPPIAYFFDLLQADQSMRRTSGREFSVLFHALVVAGVAIGGTNCSRSVAGEPDPKTYWDVKDVRPGMKGVGRTVMRGTKLEEFEAEVLGVMRDVSPGRDMVLCRLKGCNLEHAGIIQGMSGSPVYIDGKLLGAVAFAWEFAKDPIAGITPFSQMIQYVRSSDRRTAAESKDPAAGTVRTSALAPLLEGLADARGADSPDPWVSVPVSGGGLAGMTPIVTPVAASGFSPRALSFLSERLRPLGMAPMAGGAAQERIIREEGDRPLVPGSPLSIAMVTGDFDLSAIGTVTHVEGNRVYGFGHPMLSLGACELPMMTGYIHTVYPRASVSMKMGSPLKVVGVIDTDVSTSVAGRIGPEPDMLPLTVKVKTSRYADAQTYHVKVVREPMMLASLVMAVTTNAIDTEGNLPEELTSVDDGDGASERGRSDHGAGYLQRGAIHRADGGSALVQPAVDDSEHPGAKPNRPGAGRVDRLRRADRARAAYGDSGIGAIGVGYGRARARPESARDAQAAQGRARDARDQDCDSARFSRGAVRAGGLRRVEQFSPAVPQRSGDSRSA